MSNATSVVSDCYVLCTGSVGMIGDPGPAGRVGDPGPQGRTGNPGQQGFSGQAGPRGPTGATGFTGASGEKGQQGSPGNQGLLHLSLGEIHDYRVLLLTRNKVSDPFSPSEPEEEPSPYPPAGGASHMSGASCYVTYEFFLLVF